MKRHMYICYFETDDAVTDEMVQFLQQNQLEALFSQIYFWNETTLHVSDSSSIHHQDFFTVHTANLYDTTAICTVRNSWWWIEELSKTCRVLFQK